MKYFIVTILLSVFYVGQFVVSQSKMTVMCYNVENLFDTYDDPNTNDAEYLPGGQRGWNYGRYTTKLKNISQVIAAAGEWDPPTLVGLCEIENYRVLYELTTKTGLRNLNYKVIHFESPDARGVDVGLLYLPDKFKPLVTRNIRTPLPNTASTTRDILYASGQLTNGDTLHVFVNHFPSRLGGELESEPRRNAVANYLRQAVDSVYAISPSANVLIIGDFNDMPDNSAMLTVLGAKAFAEGNMEPQQLYNITYKFHIQNIGTYRYKNQWNMLDQIIVSGSLLGNGRTRVIESTVRIFSPDWLLQDDRLVGKRPFRTYIGMRYNEGYSDHLPVLVDLMLE